MREVILIKVNIWSVQRHRHLVHVFLFLGMWLLSAQDVSLNKLREVPCPFWFDVFNWIIYDFDLWLLVKVRSRLMLNFRVAIFGWMPPISIDQILRAIIGVKMRVVARDFLCHLELIKNNLRRLIFHLWLHLCWSVAQCFYFRSWEHKRPMPWDISWLIGNFLVSGKDHLSSLMNLTFWGLASGVGWV